MAAWRPRREEYEGYPGSHRYVELGRQLFHRWGKGRIVGGLLAVILLLWASSGFYMVGPGERGIVLLFGQVVGETEPGLRYRLPWPVQSHHVVDIAQVRRSEIGFRTTRAGAVQPIPAESLMLTGDENIVDIHFFVQYVVQDPVKFLFGAREPERALHASAEVALRSAVGENTIDHTMTEGRVEVQGVVEMQLQELLDMYNTGLLITDARLLVVDAPREVREAFHDVVRAWEDRERLIMEAEGYHADVVPRARGEAAEMVRLAEAFQEQRVIRARGDADRFLKVLAEYRRAEAVTRERLFLEAIDRVLPKTQKFVLPAAADGGVVPLLPLKEFVPAAAPTAGAATKPAAGSESR